MFRSLLVMYEVSSLPAPPRCVRPTLLTSLETCALPRDTSASVTVTDRPLPVLNQVLTWPAPAPAPPAPALEVEPPLLSFAESVDCARDMAASDTVTDRPLPDRKSTRLNSSH